VRKAVELVEFLILRLFDTHFLPIMPKAVGLGDLSRDRHFDPIVDCERETIETREI